MHHISSAQGLPPELLQETFYVLPRRDLPSIRLVSRLWSAAVFSIFFSAVHIHLGRHIDSFIGLLACTPAACACIRDLTISMDHGDASEKQVLVLHRLAGKLGSISSLTLCLPPPFVYNKDWHGLKLFITTHCTSARCICLRGEFDRNPRALDVFLSSFPHIDTLCVHEDMCLQQDMGPWPLGVRFFNTTLLTTLSLTFASHLERMNPTWDFPALQALNLHVDSAQAYWQCDDTAREFADVLVHILTHSVSLRLIRYFHPKRFRGSPICIILGQLLRVLSRREFTLLLGVYEHTFPDALRDDLQQADALFSRDTPEGSARIVLSCDLPDLQHLMPNLYAKGRVRLEGPIPFHDH